MKAKKFIEENQSLVNAVIATGRVTNSIKKVIAETVDGKYFVCSFYKRKGRISAGRPFDDIDDCRDYFYSC